MRKPKQETKVSVVWVKNPQGLVLWGKRQDNQKYTTPAGHQEEGETPLEAAKRELQEEAGLEGTEWEYIGEGVAGPKDDIRVSCFSCKAQGEPHSDNDPDQEVKSEDWKWVSPIGGLPEEIKSNLAVPKNNILLKLLGLESGKIKKSEMLPELLTILTLGTSPEALKELTPPLQAIAVLESNYGKTENHLKSHLGAFYTPVGPVALKPSTAFEVYAKDHRIQFEYPGHLDQTEFTDALKSDPGFYNALAEGYWKSLSKMFSDPRKQAYSWRYGPGAGLKATEEDLNKSEYVRHFLKIMDKYESQHHIKVNQLQKNDIDNLLTHPDKIERLLALKNNHVNSDQLIRALHDPEPEVNNAAITHKNVNERVLQAALYQPKTHIILKAMSHGLINPGHLDQLLVHDDQDVVRAAINHPQVTPEQLEYVLEHPGYLPDQKILAASHNNNNPANLYALVAKASASMDPLDKQLAQIALNHPKCPNQAKIMGQPVETDNAGVPMAKNIGYLLYPKLGYNQIHSEPMLVNNQAELANRLRLAGRSEADSAKDAQGKAGFMASNIGNEPVPYAERHQTGAIRTDRKSSGVNDMRAHETQHGIHQQIGLDHGRAVKDNVIAKTLEVLDPTERGYANQIVRAHKVNPEEQPHEVIAHFHNYLTNPSYRAASDSQNKVSPQESAQRVKVLRGAWNKMKARASTMVPSEVGMDPAKVHPIHNSIPNSINPDNEFQKSTQEWLRTQILTKGLPVFEDPMALSPAKPEESQIVAADQLGWRIKFMEAFHAAQFLTGGAEASIESIKQALWEHNNDPIDAALFCYGIEINEDTRNSIKALVDVQDVHKSEPEPVQHPKEITALLPEGKSAAEAVKRAFATNNVQNVDLGGKHSKGTVLAYDKETNQTWLLKPGTGESPVMGIDEEKASQSAREACFYAVAKEWGLDRFMPRCELLVIDGKQVAAMIFLSKDFKSVDDRMKDDPAKVLNLFDKYRQEGILHKWAVMEYVLGSGDSHGANELIDKDCTRIALIDHGTTFAGKDFHPGADQKAWIPFYLRAWFPKDNFNKLTPQAKLVRMPTAGQETQRIVQDWVYHTLHADTLAAILHRYGINPEPELNRLTQVHRMIQEKGLKGINELWVI